MADEQKILPYLLDGEPIDPWDLIRRAVEEGYDVGYSGALLTSEAAALLRRQGHTVGMNWEHKGDGDGG